ncbi:BREX system ATP-binding domain-containing protein [Mesorhizobium sp. M0802]|uniref:BREX system ATP-binding domain-containing protein n=1 Tax=Mesorhizobium sp. M0802 TaxID=2957001 RepID=UPI00333B04D4
MSAYIREEAFSLVPSLETAKHWAGRKSTLERIDRLSQHLSTRSDSSIDILWASFGSGKTHTLRYIEHSVQQRNERALCAFVELSESTRSFLDLYRQLSSAIDWRRIARLAQDSAVALPSDLRRAFHFIANDDTLNASLALDWLAGQKPDLRLLRQATNIQRRIEADADAVAVLAAVTQMLSTLGGKLVILIDEYQRITAIPQRQRTSITSTIRTLFNSCPKGLGVVFALTSALEQTALSLVPGEIRTLIGPKPSVTLPELEAEEAAIFCVERMRQFRPSGYNGDDYSPYGKTLLLDMISYLDKRPDVRLTPRNIIHAMSWLYDDVVDADPSQLKELKKIDVGASLGALNWEASG